jgi:molybdate transport system substrate-binding protein
VIADLRKRIQEGETADVMILSRAALDELQGQGKVASGSIVDVASSYVAIAVRAGAAKPDIGTADALKRSLLAVKSIVYADPARGGASGVHFAKVLDRLGIADQMKAKTVLVPGGQAAETVSKGEGRDGRRPGIGNRSHRRRPVGRPTAGRFEQCDDLRGRHRSGE